MGCGLGHRRDPASLWRGPAAAAPNRPLAWEPPCAAGAALKRPPQKKKVNQYWGTQSASTGQTTLYAERLPSLWDLEPGYIWGGGLPDQPRIKSPGTRSPLSPQKTTLDIGCLNSMQEKLSAAHVSPQGRDSWKLLPGFLQTLAHLPFPFAAFALFFCFVLFCFCFLSFLGPLLQHMEVPGLGV